MSSNLWAHLTAPSKLQRWRGCMGLTQQQAANQIGIDTATYNAFEKARKRPGIDIAARIELVTGGRVRLAQWADPRDAADRSRAAS